MSLRLQIENHTTLPDGGPLAVTVTGRRGIDIGRDQHLDWTLPDATRFISGKHCEVRFHDDGYWLHDVSTNGTYVNGSEDPMRGPHRLRTGDRLEIGPYIVSVAIEDLAGAGPSVAREVGRGAGDLWHVEDVAPPATLERPRATPSGPRAGDAFLDAPFDAYRPVTAVDLRPAAEPTPPWTDAPGIWDDAAPPPQRPAAAPASPTPPQPPAAPATLPADEQALRRAFAAGAGVPEATFARFTAAELATLMGGLLRLTADNLQQLLAARAELKEMVRSTQTMVAAADNNPLKLSPSVEEALRLMFAPPSASYLDAAAALDGGFRDIRQHQVQTVAAMQSAVSALARDLEPRAIEAQVEPDRGLGAVVGSRKARLWDAYVLGWKTRTGRHEDGLLGVFLEYFSEHYGRTGGRRPL